MGMSGVYMAVGDKDLKKLIGAQNDELLDRLEELEEKNDSCNIDKMWDGLHFLLTGVSALSPIEHDKLSEAIVGVTNFSLDEDADFITYTKNKELKEIIDAMQKVDQEALKANLDLARFRKNDIYPDIWNDDEKEELFAEMIDAFNSILSFYKQTLEKGQNIVVSIY
ncbi:MAG: YfbM family protein [Helicobacteraceae bacterium]|jgi:hypothetical protein|nr:YfbM family protein [Helicobacteraceae bacterium]